MQAKANRNDQSFPQDMGARMMLGDTHVCMQQRSQRPLLRSSIPWVSEI